MTTFAHVEELTARLGYTFAYNDAALHIFDGPMPGGKWLRTFRQSDLQTTLALATDWLRSRLDEVVSTRH
jgi:hypothetical protein